MLTRREMLERSLLVSLSPVVPSFLAHAARAAELEKDRRVLVVVQLDGGNDGLNTVVPMRDENYAKLRPKLKLETKELIKLSDDMALHSAMKRAGKLFDDGRLTIVQGVGYPNPNRSHFESMAIWHTARMEAAEHGQYGWLGRAMDARGGDGPQAVFAGSGTMPTALWARRASTASILSKEELMLHVPGPLWQAAVGPADDSSELARFTAAAAKEAFTTAERLAPLLSADRPADDDEPNRLAAKLAIISSLIKANSATRVYYAVQSGYDTHAAQLYEHSRLLNEFSRAIGTFLDDLKASGLADRVLLLAFSEFGRRAAENASEGTDHGAAAPVFIAGPNLASGLIGPRPNLSDLDQGDVRMAIDFRQVYATILEQWLGVPAAGVLGASFAPVPIFRA